MRKKHWMIVVVVCMLAVFALTLAPTAEAKAKKSKITATIKMKKGKAYVVTKHGTYYLHGNVPAKSVGKKFVFIGVVKKMNKKARILEVESYKPYKAKRKKPKS